MPNVTNNPTGHDLPHVEYDLGSLPVGSWFEAYTTEGVLVARGYVASQHEWGNRTRVMLITEGDGNFIGGFEAGTLARVYGINDYHSWQMQSPVKWLGVDADLARELEGPEPVGRVSDAATNGAPAVAVSVLPAVDLSTFTD